MVGEELGDVLEKVLPSHRVKGCSGFIEQREFRLLCETDGECHLCALAARQLSHTASQINVQRLKVLQREIGIPRRVDPTPELQNLVHSPPREKWTLLVEVADARP